MNTVPRRSRRNVPVRERESTPLIEEGEEESVVIEDPSQDILTKGVLSSVAQKEEDIIVPDDDPPGDLESFFKMILQNLLLRFFADDWNASDTLVFTDSPGIARLTKDEATRISDFLEGTKFGYQIDGEFNGGPLILGNMKAKRVGGGGRGVTITIDFVYKGLKKRFEFLSQIESIISYLERNKDRLFPERTGQNANEAFRLWYLDQMDNLFLARLGFESLMKLKIVDRIWRKSDVQGMEVYTSFMEIMSRVESGEGAILGGTSARSKLSAERIQLIRTAITTLVDDTVGQHDVKRQMAAIIRQSMFGLTPLTEVPYNFAFYGPPGVGKTRIATILAQVFAALGVIPKPPQKSYDDLNERTRNFRRREIGNEQPERPEAKWIDPIEKSMILTKKEDLTGAYTGWTEPLTLMKIADSLGRFLFVDEAYRLGEEGGFGTDALNTLLAAMTEYGKYMGVIIAGYQDKIDRYFFGTNPGFKSRFLNIITFSKYDPSELAVAFIRRLYGRDNPNRGFMVLDTDREFFMMKGFFSENKVYQSFAEENIRGIENLAQQVQLEVISKFTFDDVSTRLKEKKGLPIKIPIEVIRSAYDKMDLKSRPQFERTPSITLPNSSVKASGKQTGTVAQKKKCVRCHLYDAKIRCEKCNENVWCTDWCKALDLKNHNIAHEKAKHGGKMIKS